LSAGNSPVRIHSKTFLTLTENRLAISGGVMLRRVVMLDVIVKPRPLMIGAMPLSDLKPELRK
jgi:hypothetical protein